MGPSHPGTLPSTSSSSRGEQRATQTHARSIACLPCPLSNRAVLSHACNRHRRGAAFELLLGGHRAGIFEVASGAPPPSLPPSPPPPSTAAPHLKVCCAPCPCPHVPYISRARDPAPIPFCPCAQDDATATNSSASGAPPPSRPPPPSSPPPRRRTRRTRRTRVGPCLRACVRVACGVAFSRTLDSRARLERVRCVSCMKLSSSCMVWGGSARNVLRFASPRVSCAACRVRPGAVEGCVTPLRLLLV